MDTELIQRIANAGYTNITPPASMIDSVPKGTICAANEGLFTEQFFSEPLTTYAVGWKDPIDIRSLLDFITPPVEVGARFEFKTAINAEAFYSDIDDLRAIDSEFKQVEYNGVTVYSQAPNKGLQVVIDLDRYPDPTKAAQTQTARLLQRLLRNEYRRAVALLSAACTNTAKTWTSASYPVDNDFLDMMNAGQISSGIYPNRLWVDQTAWTLRLKALAAQNQAGAYAGYGLDIDKLAAWLKIDKAMVSKAVYQSTPSSKVRIGSSLVMAFIGQDGVDIDDPTSMKRFFKPTESGPFRVYSQQLGAKTLRVSVEHYSIPLVTGTVGNQQLTIS